MKRHHDTTGSLIASVPLTAEAREQLLDEFFREQLPHYGEVFMPTDDFYIVGPRIKQARHMCRLLCQWLGIKPGYIALEFEGQTVKPTDGHHRVIFLDVAVLRDEYRLSATIAYSLTRYLIEDRKQIHLPELELQTALLGTATVMFGLGLVMLNGNQPKTGGLRSLWPPKPVVQLPVNYPQLVNNFNHKHLLEQDAYSYTLLPWAAQQLHAKVTKPRTKAVLEAKHFIKVNNLKLLGVCWVTLIVVSLVGFVYWQRVRPVPADVKDATNQVNLLEQLSTACSHRYSYNRQYADLTDIQTLRVLNAQAARCDSLKQQYQTAQSRLDQLINK